MAILHQNRFAFLNLTLPIIGVVAFCTARLWILVLRFRKVKRMQYWQELIIQRSDRKVVSEKPLVKERTVQGFLDQLLPDILQERLDFWDYFYRRLQFYHPFSGLFLNSAEGMRLTGMLWGQVLLFFFLALVIVDALFIRPSYHTHCIEQLTQGSCEAVDRDAGLAQWMGICQWQQIDPSITAPTLAGYCTHSFSLNMGSSKQLRQAVLVVLVISGCVTMAAALIGPLLLFHPLRCITLAFHPAFVPDEDLDATNNKPFSIYHQTVELNDELRGACGDRRSSQNLYFLKRKPLLKLTHENTLLPLTLGDTRRRILLLAARLRQLKYLYDDRPTAKVLADLLVAPPGVMPLAQRPFTHFSENCHSYNALRTSLEIQLQYYYYNHTGFQPRKLQHLLELCRLFHAQCIYNKLRGAQDMEKDLQYLVGFLPALNSRTAQLMLAINAHTISRKQSVKHSAPNLRLQSKPISANAATAGTFATESSTVPVHGFDRDLFLIKYFAVLWFPGLQSSLLQQILVEEDTETLHYLTSALRERLFFDRAWRLLVLYPLLLVYRLVFRPGNVDVTNRDSRLHAFTTYRRLYTFVLVLLGFILLPGGILYYYGYLVSRSEDFQAQALSNHLSNASHINSLYQQQHSLTLLWQMVCVVSLVQYYGIVLPLRILLLDIVLPRLWVAEYYLAWYRCFAARMPYLLRRRQQLLLENVLSSPLSASSALTGSRFLNAAAGGLTIRENGSLLQAFHPVCRLVRHSEVLQAFPVAQILLALRDPDLTLPRHALGGAEAYSRDSKSANSVAGAAAIRNVAKRYGKPTLFTSKLTDNANKDSNGTNRITSGMTTDTIINRSYTPAPDHKITDNVTLMTLRYNIYGSNVNDEQLTRQSPLVKDRVLALLWDAWYVTQFVLYVVNRCLTVVVEVVLHSVMFTLCTERTVRTSVLDAFLACLLFTAGQWLPATYALAYGPRYWVVAIMYVWVPIGGITLGILWKAGYNVSRLVRMWNRMWLGVHKRYSSLCICWSWWKKDHLTTAEADGQAHHMKKTHDRYNERELTAVERARRRHQEKMRAHHVAQSRRMGIDLLGDIEEEYTAEELYQWQLHREREANATVVHDLAKEERLRNQSKQARHTNSSSSQVNDSDDDDSHSRTQDKKKSHLRRKQTMVGAQLHLQQLQSATESVSYTEDGDHRSLSSNEDDMATNTTTTLPTKRVWWWPFSGASASLASASGPSTESVPSGLKQSRVLPTTIASAAVSRPVHRPDKDKRVVMMVPGAQQGVDRSKEGVVRSKAVRNESKDDVSSVNSSDNDQDDNV